MRGKHTQTILVAPLHGAETRTFSTPDLICSITNVPIAQWLRRLSTEQEILGSSPSRDYSLLAQLVERGSNKPKVSGSSPL